MGRFFTSRSNVVIGVCVLVGLAALLTLAGWIFKIDRVIQPLPGLVPMQFNTAFSLLCSAIALASFEKGKRWPVFVFAGIAALFGYLNLIEWVPGVSIGVDHFLFASTLTTPQSPIAGRMSPLTAGCLVFFGFGLIGTTLRIGKEPGRLLGAVSTFCGLICTVCVASSLFRLGVISEWTQYSQMAISTGICLALLAVGGFLGSGVQGFGGRSSTNWMAGAAFLGLAFGSVVWAQAELSQQDKQAEVTTWERADGVKYQIETQVKQDVRALDRLAKRIGSGMEKTQADWDMDVQHYVKDCPEFSQIVWLEPHSKQKWIVPGNTSWLSGLDGKSYHRLWAAMQKSESSPGPSGSAILELGRHEPGFAIFVPERKKGKLIGMIGCKFRVAQLIKALPSRTLARYHFEAIDGLHVVFSSGSADSRGSPPTSETGIDSFGSKWRLKVVPGPPILSRIYTPLPKLILCCGLLISALIGYMILATRRALVSGRSERESRSFLENLSGASMTITYVLDLRLKWLTYCNQYGADLLGLNNRDLSEGGGATLIQRLVHPDDIPASRAHFTKFAHLKDGEVIEFEQRIRVRTGDYRWFHHRECVHSRNSDGSPKTILSVGHDITESKLAQELVRQSNELMEKVIDDAAIGMALLSPQGKWLRVNQALCEIVDYSEEELLKSDFQTITHPDDLDIDEQFVIEMLAGVRRTYEMEKRYIRKDGETVWVLLSVSLIRDHQDEPVHFVSQIQNISERKTAALRMEEYAIELKEANHKLEMMATTDGLTGVANRRHFDREMERLLSQAQRYPHPLSVILIDIDHFKGVNDRFGHAAGDDVLRSVAKVLRHEARESDVVARYGGEEFAIVCPHTDLASAALLADRLRQSVEAFDFSCCPISASFGVSSLDVVDERPSELLKRADEALYLSKRLGRNRVSTSETPKISVA